MGPILTLYWRPGCPYCIRLKLKLRMARIPYHAVNIWEFPDAAATVRAVNDGNELVPTARIGDRYLSNPRLRDVRAALTANTTP